MKRKASEVDKGVGLPVVKELETKKIKPDFLAGNSTENQDHLKLLAALIFAQMGGVASVQEKKPGELSILIEDSEWKVKYDGERVTLEGFPDAKNLKQFLGKLKDTERLEKELITIAENASRIIQKVREQGSEKNEPIEYKGQTPLEGEEDSQQTLVPSEGGQEELPLEGLPPEGLSPEGPLPEGMPSEGPLPETVPQGDMSMGGLPPQDMSMQGMPMQGSPQGMPPQGMPMQGPSQGMPLQMPQAPQQAYPTGGDVNQAPPSSLYASRRSRLASRLARENVVAWEGYKTEWRKRLPTWLGGYNKDEQVYLKEMKKIGVPEEHARKQLKEGGPLEAQVGPLRHDLEIRLNNIVGQVMHLKTKPGAFELLGVHGDTATVHPYPDSRKPIEEQKGVTYVVPIFALIVTSNVKVPSPDNIAELRKDIDKYGNMVRYASKKKVNPWSICTKSVGRDDEALYEKCVLDVKRKNKGNIRKSDEEDVTGGASEDLIKNLYRRRKDRIGDLISSYGDEELSTEESHPIEEEMIDTPYQGEDPEFEALEGDSPEESPIRVEPQEEDNVDESSPLQGEPDEDVKVSELSYV